MRRMRGSAVRALSFCTPCTTLSQNQTHVCVSRSTSTRVIVVLSQHSGRGASAALLSNEALAWHAFSLLFVERGRAVQRGARSAPCQLRSIDRGLCGYVPEILPLVSLPCPRCGSHAHFGQARRTVGRRTRDGSQNTCFTKRTVHHAMQPGCHAHRQIRDSVPRSCKI